ncbi:hypothetical protein [Mycobacterium sp.]|nr:hypothetical protein [Mycobacterium sp.]
MTLRFPNQVAGPGSVWRTISVGVTALSAIVIPEVLGFGDE